MSSLNLFFQWNSLLIPPLGLLLNFGLFWLILRRTPKEMWMHSRILLQTCIFDISILAIAIIGMPNVMFTQTKLILFFDGYLIHFYQHLFAGYENRLWHLYLFYIFVFHFDFFAIAVQFLYRYLLLNWDIRIKLWQYSALLFIPFIAAICISFINNSFMETPIQNPFESINFSNLAIDFNEKPIFMAFLLNESAVMHAYLMYIPFYGLTYSIIIFCGIKMVRHIAIHAMHEQLKELNKQLTKTLIILAIYPLFYSILIISILFPAILTNSMENASLFVVSLIDWILILNPLASIWTFRPYRDTLIGALKRARRIVPK